MVSAALAPLIVRELGTGSRQASKEVGKLSVELFNFDFLNLAIKLIAWFIIGILIDKIHFAISSSAANVAATVAGVFGYALPSSANEPEFFKKLFNEGYFGLKYWDFIKIGAIILTFIEFMRYYQNETRNGGSPSAFTVGIFALVMLLLSAFTVPQLIEKLRTRTPNVVNQ